MESLLVLGIAASAVICGAWLIMLIRQANSFGRKSPSAPPQGKAVEGVRYALGRGLLPWEKESTRLHLVTYAAGYLYHFGIFAAFLWLTAQIFSLPLGKTGMGFLRVIIGLGLLCGLGLFIKRGLLLKMRRISCPDDFVANGLVDLFLGLSLLTTFESGLRLLLYAATILLLLYIPFGKIRHCLFFFFSRSFFGRFFGRRGVLPPSKKFYVP
jgi:hypothetical protein